MIAASLGSGGAWHASSLMDRLSVTVTVSEAKDAAIRDVYGTTIQRLLNECQTGE